MGHVCGPAPTERSAEPKKSGPQPIFDPGSGNEIGTQISIDADEESEAKWLLSINCLYHLP
jgi:hypothetical protein